MIRLADRTSSALVGAGDARHFPRVVAGIDFSPSSLAGVRWALTHLAPGADALFAHVVPFDDAPREETSPAQTSSSAAHPRDITPALRGGLGGFAATLDVRIARSAVRVGRPSVWLEHLAADFETSLIIVGRRQDAKRKRIGEACVVERLTRRTRSPVLVVPEGVAEPPRCIVAAVDEGASGVEVLRAASALASARHLPLVALHVMAPASGSYDRIVDMRGRVTAMPEHDAAADADGGIAVAVGDPAREIVAAGVAHGGGLIVVGKRGADHAPAGSLGSVARELLATSPLPVLAIDIAG